MTIRELTVWLIRRMELSTVKEIDISKLAEEARTTVRQINTLINILYPLGLVYKVSKTRVVWSGILSINQFNQLSQSNQFNQVNKLRTMSVTVLKYLQFSSSMNSTRWSTMIKVITANNKRKLTAFIQIIAVYETLGLLTTDCEKDIIAPSIKLKDVIESISYPPKKRAALLYSTLSLVNQ